MISIKKFRELEKAIRKCVDGTECLTCGMPGDNDKLQTLREVSVEVGVDPAFVIAALVLVNPHAIAPSVSQYYVDDKTVTKAVLGGRYHICLNLNEFLDKLQEILTH